MDVSHLSSNVHAEAPPFRESRGEFILCCVESWFLTATSGLGRLLQAAPIPVALPRTVPENRRPQACVP